LTIGFHLELQEQRAAFRAFADSQIRPSAARFDCEERIPPDVLSRIAASGYLALTLPERWGGAAKSDVVWGILNEEFGAACSSVRSLLTVHGMVSHAILRWGNDGMRARWLPELAAGSTLAAFALSEANAGSDAQAIETIAEAEPGGYVLTGHKKWICYGTAAGLFLVFAQCAGRPCAFLVERNCPAVEITPLSGMLGLRGTMLADLRLDGCRVPNEALVGAPGFGLSHVANTALDLGRYSVAWGCVGIARAALEASYSYAAQRRQFGKPLKDHQLVGRMLANMVVGVRSARLMCLEAGRLRDFGDPGAVVQTMAAKYFSSQQAAQAARDAVQIHGANGCSPEYPVARYFRDSKIMEIIEGSDESQQLALAAYGFDSDS
jgi:glutaryl-CoA dehydrogenase (non-decarboxylating)